VLGCSAALVQCLWKPKKRHKPIQIAFNLANMAIGVAVCEGVFHSLKQLPGNGKATSLRLAAAAVAYFLANTLPIAGVISLTEKKALRTVWKDCYFWSFPYYLAGAGIALAISAGNRVIGWQTS